MLDFLTQARVIPIIIIDDVENAVPLAEALLEGGIKTLEVTLRTPVALDAIKQIVQHVPEMTVGAGTIVHPDQLRQVKAAGAKYAVSPGLSPLLIATANEENFHYMPGVATPTEIMKALSLGVEVMKFFPVETLGGAKAISMLHSVFLWAKFCVSGGVTLENMRQYLALEPVVAVGGSWLATRDMIKRKNWTAITKAARKTLTALKK